MTGQVCHVTSVTYRTEYGTLDESFVKTQDISKQENGIPEGPTMEIITEVVVDDKEVTSDLEPEGEENEIGESCEVDRQSGQELVVRKRRKSLTK